MIQAITNQQVGLNVITELIIGYALPGRPIAMMLFKTWGYITMAQGKLSDFTRATILKLPKTSTNIYVGFQTRPLYEDPTSVNCLITLHG